MKKHAAPCQECSAGKETIIFISYQKYVPISEDICSADKETANFYLLALSWKYRGLK